MGLSVLYIHHSGVFGGASRSLLELIRAFPKGTVRPYVISQRGEVPDIFESEGVPVIRTQGISQFDNSRYGYYRGYRWLLLMREGYYFLFLLTAVLRAKRRWKRIDLVHVNEITLLPALVLSKLLLGCPVIVHARSVQRGESTSTRNRIVRAVLEKTAACILAIDETVRKSLPTGPTIEVVHNGYSPRETKQPLPASPTLLKALSSPRKRPRFAMVGNLLPMKGVYEFVRAAKICRDRRVDAEFWILGDNVRNAAGVKGFLFREMGFSRDVRKDLEAFVRNHHLEEMVYFLGFNRDIDTVYRNIDVLCFPSHLDAAGRPVLESAFWKVPSIVAMSHPEEDTLVDGETGLCIPPGDPMALAGAVEYFCSKPAEISRMGEKANLLALKNFDMKKNAQLVLRVYERCVEGNPTGAQDSGRIEDTSEADFCGEGS